jgi:hypothetical protein
MRKALIIIGVVFLVGLVAAGSFWAGMTYQQNQVAQIRAEFFNARGQPGGGQFPPAGQDSIEGGMPSVQAGGFFRLGGTMGQIKTNDGSTITISTSQDVTTVKLTDSTRIQKSVEGTSDDLLPGTRVMVAGERDSDGVITAEQITILNIDPSAFPYPPPMGGAP